MMMRRTTDHPPFKRLKKHSVSRKHQLLYADVMATILARLPVKTLAKFRLVCKSWNLMVKDNYFVSQHLNTANNLKKSAFVRLTRTYSLDEYRLEYRNGSCIYKLDLGCLPPQRCFLTKHKYVLAPQRFYLTNSCNGLVGIYGLDSIFVTNPTINKSEILPKGSLHVRNLPCGMPSVAIGFEPSKGVYKAIRLFAREYKEWKLVNLGCEVLCLDGDKHGSWKLIDDPPALKISHVFLPFVFNGAVHWSLSPNYYTENFSTMGPEVGLSFDLKQENFKVILHPEGIRRTHSVGVLALGGCLCVADIQVSKKIQIWSSKDNANSEWVKKYSIDLLGFKKAAHSLMTPLTIENERIVFYYGQKGYREYYDLRTKSFVKHKQDTADNTELESVGLYGESMVWPWQNSCA